jgi:hypothetical protein
VIVSGPARPFGGDLGDRPHRSYGEVGEGRTQFGDRHHQRVPLLRRLQLVAGKVHERLPQRSPEGGDHAQLGRLGTELLEHDRVVVVGEHERVLGGEIAEDRARRDLGEHRCPWRKRKKSQ